VLFVTLLALAVAGQVVALAQAPAALVKIYAVQAVAGDPVPAKRRAARAAQPHARLLVAGDLVLLERPPAIAVDKDASPPAVTDHVAQHRVAPVPDFHAVEPTVDDLAVLKDPAAPLVEEDEDDDLPGVVNHIPAESRVSATVDGQADPVPN
jgi:hypothetical protein